MWLEHDGNNIKKFFFCSRGSIALKNALYKVCSCKDEGSWIGPKNLEEWKVEWEKEKLKEVSMINKKNRQSQEGHNVHCGESLSAREHVKRMVGNYMYFLNF